MRVIDSIKDPEIAEARRALARSGEKAASAFLVDGLKLVAQAVAARAPVRTVFFCAPLEDEEHRELMQVARRGGIACHATSKGVFFKLLGLGYETAVRVLAIVDAKENSVEEILAAIGPTTCLTVGERILDPRNVGVIIRNADATGTAAALFTNGSADPFSREAVRSSTGSLFRIALATTDDGAGLLKALKERGVTVYGTSARATVSLWEMKFRYPCALVFGNETSGLSDEAKALCDELVGIPIQGGASSFNVTVANGILLCEAARQKGGSGV